MSVATGGERLDPEVETVGGVREAIPGVHFRQFLSASDKVGSRQA